MLTIPVHLHPQVFYLSVVLPSCGVPDGAAASASWAPAAAGLCLFAGLGLALQARWLPRSCWEMWDVPAWTATLLFMLEPLAALVRWHSCAAGSNVHVGLVSSTLYANGMHYGWDPGMPCV